MFATLGGRRMREVMYSVRIDDGLKERLDQLEAQAKKEGFLSKKDFIADMVQTYENKRDTDVVSMLNQDLLEIQLLTKRIHKTINVNVKSLQNSNRQSTKKHVSFRKHLWSNVNNCTQVNDSSVVCN